MPQRRLDLEESVGPRPLQCQVTPVLLLATYPMVGRWSPAGGVQIHVKALQGALDLALGFPTAIMRFCSMQTVDVA